MLDVGPGVPSTLDFLAELGCSVSFADLPDSMAACGAHHFETEERAYRTFSDILQVLEGKLFDVCLFWDVLNCFDGPTLRAFGHALSPYLYSETRGHGVCNLSRGGSEDLAARGVVAIDTLQLVDARPRHYQAWSHTRFSEHLSCFRIAADTVTLEGRLEYVLESD